MSAIAGVLNRGDQPGAASRVSNALRPLGWRASGVPCVSASGPAALGSIGSTPHRDEHGFAAVFDGRLDNRFDLMRALRMDPRRASAESLIVEAYRRWGSGFAERFLGDFAFVVWDPIRCRLVAARDAVGVKPLYYRVTDAHLVVASALPAFAAAGCGRLELNAPLVAEYLGCGITTLHETLYDGVFRVPPAHTLIADARSVRVERYWDGRDAPDVRYATDSQYEDQLRALLEDAVRCRTEDASSVGVLLSGGVDSSAIASLASATRSVVGCSNVFPGCDCDESPYIDALTDAIGIPALKTVPPTVGRERVDADASMFADFPTYPNIATTDSARELAADNGIRVLLTGEGGDEWFAGSYYRYADFVQRGRLIALARAWHDDRAIDGPDGIEFPRHRVLRLGLWPVVPERFKSVVRAARPSRRKGCPAWMNPEFAEATAIVDRVRTTLDRDPGESFSRAHVRSVLARATDVHYFELAERSAARIGVDERHPFYDRRVIEFAIGLPPEQWWNRKPKELLRRTIAGIVPDSIRNRLTKANFSHVYATALAAAGDEVADDLHPLLADKVNVPEVRRMFADLQRRYAAGDGRYTEDIWPCWMIYGLDRWLRAAHAPAAPLAEEMAHA